MQGEAKAMQQSELNSLLDNFDKELSELGRANDRFSSISGSLAEFEPSPCEMESEGKKHFPDGSLNRLRGLISRLSEGQKSLNRLADRLQSQI